MAAVGVVAVVPGQWQDGICDCTKDVNICMQTTFCNLCTITNMYYKNETGIPTCDFGTCCMLWCLSGCRTDACLPTSSGLAFAFTIALRRVLLQRYGVQAEGLCRSCAIGTFCEPCNTCQMQREMTAHMQSCGGACANVPPPTQPAMGVEMQAYPAKPGMDPGVQGEKSAWAPSGQFTTGLFGCHSCMEVCEAAFCQCCVIGQIGSKLNVANNVVGAVDGQMDYPSCCGGCISCGLLGFILRRELIERYGVRNESPCVSYCCGIFCGPCEIAQMKREMGYAGEWPGGICVKEAPPLPAPQA